MILGLSSYTFGWAVGVRGQEPAQPLDEIGCLDPFAKRVGWIRPDEAVGMRVEACRSAALGRDDGEPMAIAGDQMGRGCRQTPGKQGDSFKR